MRLDEWVKAAVLHGALFIEAFAGLLIVSASLRAAWRSVDLALIRKQGPRASDRVRLDLGLGLALALEFLVGADVLRTAVAPTWDGVGKLASIVVIRTLLNFFLERERDSLEAEISAAGARFAKG